MAAVFCACHALVLAPWAVRNTQLQGVFTVVDTISGFNLWMANSAATPPDRIWDAISQGGAERFSEALAVDFPGRGLTEGQKDHWGRAAAFDYMLQHPGVTLGRSLRKFADFWGLDRELIAGMARGLYSPPRWAAIGIAAAVMLAYPTTMFLAATGLWLTPKRAWPTHALVLTLLFFVCAIHTIVFGHSRYRLPMMPFFLIYAAAALSAGSWRRLAERRWATVAAGSMVALLGAIWLQEILIRDADRVRSLLSRLTP